MTNFLLARRSRTGHSWLRLAEQVSKLLDARHKLNRFVCPIFKFSLNEITGLSTGQLLDERCAARADVILDAGCTNDDLVICVSALEEQARVQLVR